MYGIGNTDTMMEIVRFILGLEVALAILVLLIVGIRAFGPNSVKTGLIHSIVAAKRLIHLD